MMTKPKYILTVEYGDPNTNLALRTALGIFETKEEAEKCREKYYKDTNHICTIYPLNWITIQLNNEKVYAKRGDDIKSVA